MSLQRGSTSCAETSWTISGTDRQMVAVPAKNVFIEMRPALAATQFYHDGAARVFAVCRGRLSGETHCLSFVIPGFMPGMTKDQPPSAMPSLDVCGGLGAPKSAIADLGIPDC